MARRLSWGQGIQAEAEDGHDLEEDARTLETEDRKRSLQIPFLPYISLIFHSHGPWLSTCQNNLEPIVYIPCAKKRAVRTDIIDWNLALVSLFSQISPQTSN